jgi:hypothetical protein
VTSSGLIAVAIGFVWFRVMRAVPA